MENSPLIDVKFEKKLQVEHPKKYDGLEKW